MVSPDHALLNTNFMQPRDNMMNDEPPTLNRNPTEGNGQLRQGPDEGSTQREYKVDRIIKHVATTVSGSTPYDATVIRQKTTR